MSRYEAGLHLFGYFGMAVVVLVVGVMSVALWSEWRDGKVRQQKQAAEERRLIRISIGQDIAVSIEREIRAQIAEGHLTENVAGRTLAFVLNLQRDLERKR